jgi:hypothetical protein
MAGALFWSCKCKPIPAVCLKCPRTPIELYYAPAEWGQAPGPRGRSPFTIQAKPPCVVPAGIQDFVPPGFLNAPNRLYALMIGWHRKVPLEFYPSPPSGATVCLYEKKYHNNASTTHKGKYRYFAMPIASTRIRP